MITYDNKHNIEFTRLIQEAKIKSNEIQIFMKSIHTMNIKDMKKLVIAQFQLDNIRLLQQNELLQLLIPYMPKNDLPSPP